MTLESLKDKWQKTNKPGRQQQDNVQRMANELSRIERGRCAAARLSARYLRLGVIAFLVPLMLIPISEHIRLGLWFIWIYSLTMVVLGVMNLFVSHKIHKTDVFSMPVVEAAAAVMRLRRLTLRMRMAGIIIALPALTMIFTELNADPDRNVIWGAIIGAVVGVVIAVVMNIQIMRRFREMMAPFK